MQDYAKQLLSAINQYDADNPESVNHLRDLVCWISDNDALKKDKVLAQLLYIASQKMRVFGYNKECIRDKDFRDILSLQACIIDDAEYLDEKI